MTHEQTSSSNADIHVTFTRDEWHALRFAVETFHDLVAQAPIIEGTATRSEKMKSRRAAARLRDKVYTISTDNGFEGL